MTKKNLNKDSLQEKINRAREAAVMAKASEPRAKTAVFDFEKNHITIHLTNGASFSFHPSLAEGLAEASPEDLAEVEVTPSGEGLHWEKLDIDFSIPALLMGVFGSKTWVAGLGKKGGQSRSLAKSEAARQNGKKGGRPPKATIAKVVDLDSSESEQYESTEKKSICH